jgi:hypothetical protein
MGGPSGSPGATGGKADNGGAQQCETRDIYVANASSTNTPVVTLTGEPALKMFEAMTSVYQNKQDLASTLGMQREIDSRAREVRVHTDDVFCAKSEGAATCRIGEVGMREHTTVCGEVQQFTIEHPGGGANAAATLRMLADASNAGLGNIVDCEVVNNAPYGVDRHGGNDSPVSICTFDKLAAERTESCQAKELAQLEDDGQVFIHGAAAKRLFDRMQAVQQSDNNWAGIEREPTENTTIFSAAELECMGDEDQAKCILFNQEGSEQSRYDGRVVHVADSQTTALVARLLANRANNQLVVQDQHAPGVSCDVTGKVASEEYSCTFSVYSDSLYVQDPAVCSGTSNFEVARTGRQSAMITVRGEMARSIGSALEEKQLEGELDAAHDQTPVTAVPCRMTTSGEEVCRFEAMYKGEPVEGSPHPFAGNPANAIFQRLFQLRMAELVDSDAELAQQVLDRLQERNPVRFEDMRIDDAAFPAQAATYVGEHPEFFPGEPGGPAGGVFSEQEQALLSLNEVENEFFRCRPADGLTGEHGRKVYGCMLK